MLIVYKLEPLLQLLVIPLLLFLVQLTYFSVVGPDSTTYTEENVLEMLEQDSYRLLAKLTVSVHRDWSCVVELLL